MLARILCLSLALCGVTPAAHAASVSLNGVSIDGVTNQRFEDCIVEIDAYGNVNIVAPGYAARGNKKSAAKQPSAKVGDPTTAVTPGQVGEQPGREYWLVTEKPQAGMTQYDVDLFINGKWVRKFLDDETHVVLNVTKFLRTGPNKLVFIAKKRIDSEGRRSSSPKHYGMNDCWTFTRWSGVCWWQWPSPCSSTRRRYA